MKNKLPTNWTITKVGNICSQLRGISYQKGDAYSSEFENSVWVLRGGNIQNGKIVINKGDEVYVSKELVKEEQLIKKGDVIIVSSTGSKALIGKAAHAINDMPTTGFGAFLTLLRPKNEIDNLYFNYFFQTDYYRESIRELSGGININNIRRDHIDQLEFPVAPIVEQKQISKKLDEIFGHLELLNNRLDRIPELIKTFKEKVLTYAVNGKLTEDWRNKNKSKQDWRNITVAEFMEEVKDKADPVIIKQTKYLGLEHIERDGKLIGYGSSNDVRSLKTKFIKGDVLYGKLRPYLNKHLVVDFDGVCSTDILVYRNKDIYCAKWFDIFLGLPETISKTNSDSKGINLPRINASVLNTYKIPVPPIDEIREIVNQVEKLFLLVQSILEKHTQFKKPIDLLPISILSQAFKGHLVK